MGLSIYDAIEMTLDACKGTITGKTAMQKLLYFQAQKIPEIRAEIPDYTNYYYGPFSRKLAAALLDLSSFVLIYINMSSWSNNGFVYTLSDDGKECADVSKNDYPDEYATISDIVEKCKAHCDLRADPLSYAAKSHFVIKEFGDINETYQPDDIIEMAKRFNWKMSRADVKTGMALLGDLDLDR
ncbi:MAG: hypothetical protein MPK75_10480 [Alphaproteobacteria bacterium]|nr:hypothetical protein [Alphaproteobacteria bacterium]